MKQTLGQRIAAARKDRGLTQRELSELTGGKIKTTRLANYEQGTREPGLDEIATLAQALKLSAAYLAGFSDLKTQLCKQEAEVIKCFRLLPDGEKDQYLKKLKAISIIFADPVHPVIPPAPSSKIHK